MLKKIISNKMSVRAVEEEIKELYPKEENNEGVGSMDSTNMVIPAGTSTPVTNNFINSSPLMPTTEVQEPENNSAIFGEIKTIPSSTEQTSENFINYGEIDDDDEEEQPMQFNNPVDLNSIRNNAIDINGVQEEKQSPAADLDSLLNLQNIAAGPSLGSISGTNQFLTPAEEIVKTDELKQQKPETTADYFKTADYIPNNPASNVGIPEITVSSNYNIDTAMQKIRDAISEIKSHGVSIQADEMNFDNSYQIIIKLDK